MTGASGQYCVGLVTGEFPPMQGGVGDYSQALARALAALEVDVHVITDRRCAPLRAASVEAGFTLHPAVGAWSFASLWRVRTLARALRCDVLNLQYQAAAYGLSAPIHWLPQAAGLKTVVTFHDLRIPYLFPKAGPLRPWAVTHLARSASGVIATDPADQEELRRRGIARPQHIPIGSNIAVAPPTGYDRTAWRARLGLAAGDFLLGHFGFLNASKGADTLLSALAILADRQARARLVLIGGPTGSADSTNRDFEAQIEKMIRRYNLEARVIRTGFVAEAEVSAHLLACDAVVLPYRDGASLRRGSLMAALAHGCAIITTQPSTPVPGFSDGDNLRLVPADDAPAIVLAVSQLLDAPDLRARLGHGAQALAASFTWEAIARRTLEFFRSL